MATAEKIVVVTKKTALEELVERQNTRDQARFYITHLNQSFDEYQNAHDTYHRSLDFLKAAMPDGVRVQYVDRTYLPNFVFDDNDLVVTLGPDGLVVNTAKYLTSQRLLAINPDPQRMDGVLISFDIHAAPAALKLAACGHLAVREVTMARAVLDDGQTIYALNDLFIGQRSHISARYRIVLGEVAEDHSSSGIIVSTGAGSTGWYRSVLTAASHVVASMIGDNDARGAAMSVADNYRFAIDSDELRFCVREPFVSRISQAGLVYGNIAGGRNLNVTSQMPQGGVIFSDGVEADYLEFSSGLTAKIGVADRKLNLITSG